VPGSPPAPCSGTHDEWRAGRAARCFSASALQRFSASAQASSNSSALISHSSGRPSFERGWSASPPPLPAPGSSSEVNHSPPRMSICLLGQPSVNSMYSRSALPGSNSPLKYRLFLRMDLLGEPADQMALTLSRPRETVLRTTGFRTSVYRPLGLWIDDPLCQSNHRTQAPSHRVLRLRWSNPRSRRPLATRACSHH
jgi:hypothetical protein